MQISTSDFTRLAPNAKQVAALVPALNKYFTEYGIDTTLRLCHFLAQAAHESGGFQFYKELWGPSPAQRGYEGRKDLGNTQTGDGYRFRGRGIFQLTGRANYREYGRRLDLDLEANPDLASLAENSVRIALEYWDSKKLNTFADLDDIRTITKKINGGNTGLKDREDWLRKARIVFDEE